jgi:hypothetical protein
MRKSRLVVLGIGLLGLCGLLVPSGMGAEPTVDSQPFHARLLKIAEIYSAYGRIDDEFRWAPELCRMPMPGRPRYSQSSDEAAHGQKLYSLFVRDRASYLTKTGASPVGQIVVKEAWIPEEMDAKPKLDFSQIVRTERVREKKVPDDLAPLGLGASLQGGDHFYPIAERKGKWYRAKERGPLFLMMKLDPKTPGTDEGWVYGTVSADGKTVTSAGRVASCMKCHEDRKDRLFGLMPTPAKKEKP